MEQLIQKYIKYFYFTLICTTMVQLVDIIIKTIYTDMNIININECNTNTFILIFLSIVNIMLLINSWVHNVKQKFTECKTNAKILRLTMAMLICLQAWISYKMKCSVIVLGNYLTTVMIIEIVLSYRIKSIEYLEKQANELVKDTTPNQERGK